MRRFTLVIILVFTLTSILSAQTDRKEIRSGNRAYRDGDIARAEIDYRRALAADSGSVFARYNLGNALHKRDNSEEAGKILGPVLDSIADIGTRSAAFHNLGNYALDGKKYKEAIDYYKDALRLNPGDYETKSNLAYAQKMLENEESGGGGGNQDQDQQDQDQNQDQQNQDQDQNQDQQNQDQNQDQNQQNQGQNDQNQPPPSITPQDAQQMLQAIQNKENETQEKVQREKAKLLQSKQREKNW